MKRYGVIIAVVIVVILITAVIIWEQWSSKQEKSLQQVLRVNPNTVTHLGIYEYGVITDDKQITDLLAHLNQYHYKKKAEDSLDYPRENNEHIWFSLQDDKGNIDILFVYDTEVMVSSKAYTVVDGPIDMDFLLKYKNLWPDD